MKILKRNELQQTQLLLICAKDEEVSKVSHDIIHAHDLCLFISSISDVCTEEGRIKLV